MFGDSSFTTSIFLQYSFAKLEFRIFSHEAGELTGLVDIRKGVVGIIILNLGFCNFSSVLNHACISGCIFSITLELFFDVNFYLFYLADNFQFVLFYNIPILLNLLFHHLLRHLTLLRRQLFQLFFPFFQYLPALADVLPLIASRSVR